MDFSSFRGVMNTHAKLCNELLCFYYVIMHIRRCLWEVCAVHVEFNDVGGSGIRIRRMESSSGSSSPT